MLHPIYRITSFKILAPFTLKVEFDNKTIQKINFKPILKGPMFGPLNDLSLFNQVKIDSEVHTLVWPNGADFDPATLHDWQELRYDFEQLSNKWTDNSSKVTLEKAEAE